ADDAPRWANWGAERHQPWWVRWLAHIALVLAAVGVGVGILSAAEVIPGTNIAVTAVTMTALAGITGVSAFAARWVHSALSGRVDILSQALEASPDAQLVLDPAGRIVYANTAFNDLFPNAGTAPLARIAEAVADTESTDDFIRLQEKAMTGSRAIAALPLRDARGAAAGWFNIEVNPIVGRPGYSFWNLQDITARHEMETVIHDERNRVVDFFDDAPVGFYSVDAEGRFLFVNETLARWLDMTPAEVVGSGAVLHDFLAVPPPPGTAPSDPIGSRGENGQRGDVVLRSRDGRNLHVSIGQTMVGAGTELRT